MKKILCSIVLLLLCVNFSYSGELRVIGLTKTEGIYNWYDIDPVFGVCSYVDDVVDGNILGYYAQFPLVKYDDLRLNFGVVVPTEYTDVLTRPTFSISYLWTDTLNLPDWIGLETGVYYAVGPYHAYGAQLGLLRIKW
jgi:hypothetical protein